MNSAKVTVIVPTYRRPLMLKRTLTSIRAQSYGDFIVHILDNDSGDGTEETAKRFTEKDARFQYLCHGENIGSIRNLFYGLDLVDTPFFCYLADDDLWMPDFLERAVRTLEKHREAGFFGAMSVCVDEGGIPYSFSGPPGLDGYFPPSEGAKLLWDRGWPQQAATLYRTEVLEKVGPMSPILGCDLDYLTRVAIRYGVYLSSRPYAFFTINRCSASSSRTVELVTREWRYIREQIEQSKWLDEEGKKDIIRSWKKRMPYQIRMMTMLSLVSQNKVDAALGAKLLHQEPGFMWTVMVIKAAVYVGNMNRVFFGLVSALFRFRMSLFILVRKTVFFIRHRHNNSIYWLSVRLTRTIADSS